MNNIKFQNNYYEEALDYVQKYTKFKENGYYKVDLIGKSDQIQMQQNNMIITLLV